MDFKEKVNIYKDVYATISNVQTMIADIINKNYSFGKNSYVKVNFSYIDPANNDLCFEIVDTVNLKYIGDIMISIYDEKYLDDELKEQVDNFVQNLENEKYA